MKRILSKVVNTKPDISTIKEHKWVLNTVMIIGGILIGAGVADCLMSLNQLNVDQLARGLTIFSAGVTICVLVDNTKAQKATNKTHQETQIQLKNVEKQLEAILHSQQLTEQQIQEIKERALKDNEKTSALKL
ncbi:MULTISPECIES: hypothetical protein [Paenibacillus]|uniref:Holin n=1 Tax=Paenibacillus vini TaxID=1476024 RepID=A0ABQ4M9B7_9BACL|nr:hypothetical protein [Paenibacillus vini]MDN4070592.1 hypothetical protein [Paenibacillus vini]GIP52575.1 hypothetical protein J42TS3_16100 [Paenibacillus vini]